MNTELSLPDIFCELEGYAGHESIFAFYEPRRTESLSEMPFTPKTGEVRVNRDELSESYTTGDRFRAVPPNSPEANDTIETRSTSFGIFFDSELSTTVARLKASVPGTLSFFDVQRVMSAASSRTQEHVEVVDADVDMHAVSTVEMLNEIDKWETTACCSGVYFDHYDMEILSVTEDEIAEHGRVKNSHFKFRCGFEQTETGVSIPRRFFDLQSELNKAAKTDSPWVVRYSEPSRFTGEKCDGSGIGSVEIPRECAREWLYRSNSVEDYDNRVCEQLVALQNAIKRLG